MLKGKKAAQSSKKRGFTIVELLVIAPIVILTIGAFITVIVNMTGDVLASRATNVLTYSIQDALNRIEGDVKLSTGFLAENNVALTTPQGFGNDTTNFENTDGTNGNMLILNTLATTGNPISTTSGLIYLTNQPNGCNDSLVNQNKPMTLNVIYFVKDDTLWRRVVMPSNYLTAGCNIPWQQPSCNPSVSGAFCKTQDIRLVDNVKTTDFVTQYFSAANSLISDSVANDPTKTALERNTALQSLTTVSATINVNATTAGRNISQSGTIRATKLDINASTIADAIVPVTPATPTVSGSTSAPVSAVFTWPAVQGATSYSVDYNINGGAWTTGFTNQNTTTYTVPGCDTASAPCSTHTDVVNVRVTATNIAGTSGYATSSITIPLWTNIVLKNNWIDYSTSNWATAAYTKTRSGLVVLKGLIKSGSASAVIGSLPVGYRPSQTLLFQSIATSASSRVDVYTNGDIRIVSGSGDLSLESIRFMPTGTTFTNVAPPFYNGWANYGDAGYVIPPQYNQDSSGRINLQAMIGSGTVTDGTTMFVMPAGLRPTLYAHLPSNNCGVFGVFALDQNSTGDVEAKGGSNCWYSIHTIYYPASRASGGTYGSTSCTTQWCNLTLQNSWIYYNPPFSTPEYTKGNDGMVMLKGLLRAGATGGDTVIATLPSGYRPAQRLLITIPSNGALARVDILPDGTIRFEIGSNAWLSIDNIIFMADGS